MHLRAGSIAVVGCGVIALAVSGCGSSGSKGGSGSSGSGATGGGTSSTGSSAPAATGTPIVLGFPNQENSAAGSFPEAREAAAAAVKYVNASLGGVNGRPLKLDTCITDAAPATSANCANQFVRDKVVAVTSGLDFGSAGSLPILSKAGIPVLGGVPAQAADYTTPGVFSFTGGTAGAVPSGMAYFVQKENAKKVSIIYFDSPAGQQAATAFGKNVLKKLGVTDVTLVPSAATLSDFTAPLQQANASNPDLIVALEPGAIYGRILSAKQALGISTKMLLGNYPGEAVIKAAGAGANGVYFVNDQLVPDDTSDPQVAAYVKAMKKYAPNTAVGGFSQNGFQTIMNTFALLKKLPASSVTPAALLAAVKATVNEPNFMGHPYTCDGKQIPGFSAPCDAFNRIVQYKDGKLSDVAGAWISGAKYVG